MNIRRITEQNSTLKNQLLQLTEAMRKEEEKSHSLIKEKERREKKMIFLFGLKNRHILSKTELKAINFNIRQINKQENWQ